MSYRVQEILLQNKEEIIKKRNNGATYTELAKEYNISTTPIKTLIKQYNLGGYGIKNFKPGQIFEKSNLKIIERDYDPPFKSHETAYKCKCLSCGDIKTYRKSNIENGPGCHQCSGVKGGRGYREWEIGDKFGFLTIIEKGEKPGYVKCQCDCGTIKDINICNLKGQKHSRTISCGCNSISSGELKISQILKEYNINFKQQYQIKDFSLYSLFDFAILDNDNKLVKLIEYDGEQHYKPVEIWGGEEKLKIQQERDIRKNNYCKEYNIPLLRIPYWDYNKIDIQYLFPNFPEID